MTGSLGSCLHLIIVRLPSLTHRLFFCPHTFILVPLSVYVRGLHGLMATWGFPGRTEQDLTARPHPTAPAEEQGGRKAARAATALGMGHLPGDGPKPGQAISLQVCLGLAQQGSWRTQA